MVPRWWVSFSTSTEHPLHVEIRVRQCSISVGRAILRYHTRVSAQYDQIQMHYTHKQKKKKKNARAVRCRGGAAEV